MKKGILLSISMLLLLTTAWAPGNKKWEKLLAENQLVFEPNGNYKPTKVYANRDLYFNYAMKHKSLDLEVRYSIMPILKFDDEDGTTVSVDGNKLYRTLLMTNAMNVSQKDEYFGRNGSGPTLPEVNDFPPEAVMNEFNADAGATTAFDIQSEYSEFGKDYKWGLMFIIHRDDVCDVNITFLANDKDVLSDNFLEAFHFLTFTAKESQGSR